MRRSELWLLHHKAEVSVPRHCRFDVVRLVAQRRPGDRVRLTLWRDRRRLEVTVVLMARPRE